MKTVTIYTDGFYFDLPETLAVFGGNAEEEKPVDRSLISGMTDLSAYIYDKSCAGTPGTKADEAPQRIFDGSTASKWCETTTATPYVAFRTKTPVYLSAYAFCAGNDTASHTDRNPKCWTLWGSADGENWVPLDSVYNGQMKTSNYSQSVYLANESTPACSYFVLTIHALNGSGSTMQISELSLYGTV